MYRARETDRPDALFRDPYARKLMGDREERIAEAMKVQDRNSWSFVMRTFLYDQFIMECIERGANTVVNLAAGLDARPYRMDLPSSLRWFEVDLPEMIAYKNEVLRSEKPRCALERVPLDLSDKAGSKALFERIGRGSQKGLIITEGLLIYLDEKGVSDLSRDLAAVPGFQNWVFNLASPALLRMMMKSVGGHLTSAGAPLKFAPESGVDFFVALGWRPASVRSIFREAVKLRRTPLWMMMLLLFPEPPGGKTKRIWSGVCLMERAAS